ncbi:restriction endonuclease [Halopseudomonas pachastrellae]|uniref:Restriction endonuclease n=1 Tax=Halopseudomonas pachastrellae TaxID=254161 RepID=A0A1S8DAK0_9GAMM|nr:McrC family protein [Halopseudomonas pachastrellae]ONM42458.1 restriction endonuclease [Halopseudomonas pachastrellae]SFN01308.1 5-methylcytosine-specific restriction enzyme subunit McrC [Halopseudomonas pachastrellae]
MSASVVVREYACLTTAPVAPDDLDCAQVSESAFDWLCELSARFNSNGAKLLQVQGRRSLKWDSYVGVLETPCGTRLEIVPKHHEEGDCLQKGRQLLRKLIQRALDLKAREASVAGLELFEAPLSEWVMAQFLAELDLLVKRGVRFDYQRVEEEQRFLRGQLNVVAQMRQRPGKQHYFQIRHDVFQPNRAENRLLKSALEQVAKSTRDANNWRLAAELRAMLSDLPASRQIDLDFRAWSTDRLMAHYQAIKPWCELILNQQMPLAVSGEWRGMSMLFPMEKLFERYVEGWLRNCLVPGAELITQGKGIAKSLCKQGSEPVFELKPDFLVDNDGRRWVLDAKWKRAGQGAEKKKEALREADFYQLFAYGHKYLDGKGELALIYPRTRQFDQPLPPFDYSPDLRLWALPFDLDADRLLIDDEMQFTDCTKAAMGTAPLDQAVIPG